MASIIINNEELRTTFHAVIAIQTALNKELVHVTGNKSHIDKLVPEYLVKTYSLKDKTAQAFSDNINNNAYDGAVVLLTATFERIVFSKYSTAYGSFKSVLQDSAKKPIDYFDSRERFVNDSYNWLADIIMLLDGIIDADLLKDLKTIKDHRNYIAHGKRTSTPPVVEFPIEKIAKTLDSVILEIEK